MARKNALKKAATLQAGGQGLDKPPTPLVGGSTWSPGAQSGKMELRPRLALAAPVLTILLCQAGPSSQDATNEPTRVVH